MIDVIIPAYNAENTLRRAVASALACREVRVILVDDGSTDATPEICDDLADNDVRVTAVHQPNRGVSEARNAGLALAKADHVTFLDADDELLPGALEALHRADVPAIQGRVVRKAHPVPAKPAQYRVSTREALEQALSNPTAHLHTHGWLFRREALHAAFDPNLSLGEDGEWLLRVLLGMDAQALTVAFLDAPVYRYALRPDSALHGGSAGVCEGYMRTLRTAAPALEQAQLPHAAALYRLTHLLLMLTHGNFRAGWHFRCDPMFQEAFRLADLRGNSPRMCTLRWVRQGWRPLAFLAVKIRRIMNK